jgi:spoIIIJ-associated protein
VKEAVAAGLGALGLTRDQVEIDVLDEGSRGILGIGGRPARVRLVPVSPPSPPERPAPAPPEPELPPQPGPAAGREEQQQEEEVEVACTALRALLDRLGFPEAEIRVIRPDPSSEGDGTLILDVRGQGVNALIGHNGSTLAALQRIVRLMVGKQLTRWVSVRVDVGGHEQERERALRRLARRKAGEAVRHGRTVYLDPMTPYDRRLVHIELRDDPRVRTESVGEGRDRRVTIIPAG